MKPRKFTGTRSRDVLEQVRNELGADAMIVSNRATADGIEVLAIPGDAIDALIAGDPSPRRAEVVDTAPPVEAVAAGPAAPPAAAPAPIAAAPAEPDAMPRLMGEVAMLRKLLEEQLGGLAWSDLMRRKPVAARMQRDLLAAGFSPALARDLAGAMPEIAVSQVRPWISRALASRLDCIADGDDPLSAGGVFALVGPTGVGKTTTVAKLAARAAVRFGASKVSLLTTDSFRVGAHDQLRLYGRILGIHVQAVAEPDDLKLALDRTSGRHLVLIDTVGLGQRDRRVADQRALLADPRIRKLVLMNATAQGPTLEEVLASYGEGASPAGVILTKLDEAARLAPVVDVAARHAVRIAYVTHGQRVPEDLSHPNADVLADRALRVPTAANPFALTFDEMPLAAGEGMPEPAYA
jgi:flagellar biosynthesis protein FlhF